MTGPINPASRMLEQLRISDPFAAANIDKFNKEQERKREFIESMMRKLPPSVWAVLGPMITEAVIKAPGNNLDQAFAEIEKMVDNYLKAAAMGAGAEIGRMGFDALKNAESSPVLAALDVVEKFLGSAAPKARDKEA